MADILIRGMDKPHNCFQCDLSHFRGERLFCHVTKDEVLRSKIASDCPIQELPEHGDLIDRLDTLNMLNMIWYLYPDDRKLIGIIYDQIKDQIVVVPAERGDTDA